jgi:hypothetical protein
LNPAVPPTKLEPASLIFNDPFETVGAEIGWQIDDIPKA